MAVYYKFKSAKDFDSIPIEGQFISVANLKERIFETKNLGRGTDFDLMLSNAQNDEEYVDEAAMIPKNTSVLIRRIPGRPRRSIANDNDEPKAVENKVEDLPPSSGTFVGDSSTMRYPEESEWDEFGNDLYAIPEVVPAQSINPVLDVSPAYMVDEDSKIKALIDTPSLDWNRQSQDTYGAGRGYGRGFGGRMMAGRGFGRGGGLERKTPPAGYICHRCKVPGHFIQHCPTNGDPNYDVKRVKPPTGIPKSMLMATPDGSYALPSGAVAVLKPNEAAFEKEIEGIPTTRTVTANDFPPEFICPLCKEVMKDAALTSKCCCRSFCDKCIRDYIISKTMCICGATDILADDLLPNRTVRESINRILESTTSSNDNAGSLVQVPDMESVRHVQSKVTSPTFSAVSRDEVNLPPSKVNFVDNKKEGQGASEGKEENVSEHSFNKKAVRNTDQSEATLESISVKEPISPESAPVPDEAQEKLLANDPGKKKKKKKARIPGTEMQWRPFQDFGAENFTGMPLPPSSFNPYWHGGMPMGIDGYMAPFTGNMPYMGYTPGPPFDVPFGGMLPQDPFAAQAYMMSGAPQRDLSELVMGGMGMNQGPSIMSREEFEARKADLRRKREIERHSEREHSKDRGREAAPPRSSVDVPPTKAKTHHLTSHSASGVDRPKRTERSDRSERWGRGDRNEPRRERDSLRRSPQHRQPQTSGKRKAAAHDEAATASEAVADKKQKTSVFSRISFPGPGEGGSKKRKSEESPKTAATNSVPPPPVNGYRYDHESSEEEEEYHFKRRPSSSSQREAPVEKEGRAGRGSRDREQGHASCRSST